MPRTRLISIVTLLLLVATGVCEAQPTPPRGPAAQSQTLRVATGQTAPFVLDENGVLTGFSIDLWQEIARRLKREFVWVKFPSNSSVEQLQAIVRGDADVAISAITMTPEREQSVDFSTSYFDSGLQIMVPAVSGTSYLSAAAAIVSSGIRQIALSDPSYRYIIDARLIVYFDRAEHSS